MTWHVKIILAFVIGFSVATLFAGDWVFDQDKGTVTDGEFVYSATLMIKSLKDM